MHAGLSDNQPAQQASTQERLGCSKLFIEDVWYDMFDM